MAFSWTLFPFSDDAIIVKFEAGQHNGHCYSRKFVVMRTMIRMSYLLLAGAQLQLHYELVHAITGDLASLQRHVSMKTLIIVNR